MRYCCHSCILLLICWLISFVCNSSQVSSPSNSCGFFSSFCSCWVRGVFSFMTTGTRFSCRSLLLEAWRLWEPDIVSVCLHSSCLSLLPSIHIHLLFLTICPDATVSHKHDKVKEDQTLKTNLMISFLVILLLRSNWLTHMDINSKKHCQHKIIIASNL